MNKIIFESNTLAFQYIENIVSNIRNHPEPSIEYTKLELS